MEHTRGHRPRGRQTVGIVSFLGVRTALFGIFFHGPDTLLIRVGRRHDLPPVSVNAYSLRCRFLGIVDKLGAAYEEDFVSTSFGLYFCLPLMRLSLPREHDRGGGACCLGGVRACGLLQKLPRHEPRRMW